MQKKKRFFFSWSSASIFYKDTIKRGQCKRKTFFFSWSSVSIFNKVRLSEDNAKENVLILFMVERKIVYLHRETIRLAQ